MAIWMKEPLKLGVGVLEYHYYVPHAAIDHSSHLDVCEEGEPLMLFIPLESGNSKEPSTADPNGISTAPS